MSKIYTELSCGCKVSCINGGGFIPCENNPDICESYKYLDDHFFCDICEEYIVCFDHTNCTDYPGGVE